MLKNPGLGPWDRCDLLEGKKGLSAEDREFATSAADDCLALRQKLYCDQLNFNCKRNDSFIFLNDAFDTAKRGGRNPRNANLWYRRYLLSRNGMFDGLVDLKNEQSGYRFLSKNVFVLDYVPYHSKNFEDPKVELIHHRFWKALVRYALCNDRKLLVFWGHQVLEKLQADKELASCFEDAVSNCRVAVIKSRQVYFSPRTTYLLANKSLIKKVVKR